MSVNAALEFVLEQCRTLQSFKKALENHSGTLQFISDNLLLIKNLYRITKKRINKESLVKIVMYHSLQA